MAITYPAWVYSATDAPVLTLSAAHAATLPAGFVADPGKLTTATLSHLTLETLPPIVPTVGPPIIVRRITQPVTKK